MPAGTRFSSPLASSPGVIMIGTLSRVVAVAACYSCFAAAFIGSPLSVVKSGCNRHDSSKSTRVSKVSSSDRAAASGAQHRMHPGCLHLRTSRRHTRRPLPQSPLQMSSRTVDVDVIDVIDVTEEEARREEEQVFSIASPCIRSCSGGTERAPAYRKYTRAPEVANNYELRDAVTRFTAYSYCCCSFNQHEYSLRLIPGARYITAVGPRTRLRGTPGILITWNQVPGSPEYIPGTCNTCANETLT